MSELQDVVLSLALLERERRAYIAARVKLENMAASRVRSVMGFNPRAKGEEAPKALKETALAIVRAVAEGKPLKGENAKIAEAVADFVGPVMGGVPQLEKAEKAKVKAMEKLAARLPSPVVEFQKSRKGFGLRGLAVIIATCHGDGMNGLADFSEIAKVWRRMGLEASPADKERVMYKINRSQAFAFIYDPIIRAQIRRVGDEATATGPDGQRYLDAKAKYLRRVELTADLPKGSKEKWTPKRADLAARRVMAKRLLKDLWRAWRAETKSCLRESAIEILSPSPTSSADEAGRSIVPVRESAKRRLAAEIAGAAA